MGSPGIKPSALPFWGCDLVGSIPSASRTLKSVMCLLSAFLTSYEFRKCVLKVKPWKIWVANVNSVESVSMCSGRTPQVNLWNIYGCQGHLCIICHFSKFSWIRRRVSATKGSETEMGAAIIINGTKILRMCVDNLHFLDSFNYLPISLKSMPKWWPHIQEGLLPPLFNTSKNFNYVSPPLDP